MKLAIRPAQPSDISTMYGISSRAHLAAYYDTLIPPEQRAAFDARYLPSEDGRTSFVRRLTTWMEDPNWTIEVAVQADRVIGYTLAMYHADMLELRGLFVDPDFQSAGVGTLLFETSLNWRREGETIRLTVIASNERAKRLYDRHGFKVTGPAKQRFYGANQEVMEWRGY